MKCDLCKKSIVKSTGAYYWVDNKCKSYCNACSPKIENMSRLPEVMIVPITTNNFKEVKKKKLYFHPIEYGRKGGKFIAFYLSRPQSAITHLAKVKLILKENHVKLYFLESVQPLKKMIHNDGSGVQGSRNTTLERLKKAKFLKDLK